MALAVGGIGLLGVRRLLRPRAVSTPPKRGRTRQARVARGPWWQPSLITAVATAPPLGEVLEERLSTHMVQHIVLITVSAPLLAMCGCGLPLLVGLPRFARQPLVRLRRRYSALGVVGPHAAWGLHIAALWLWHLPAAYDEAVRSTYAHASEHACFLLTAWLFWWHLLGPARRRLRGPAAVLYLVAAIPPGAAIGALLTFSNHPLYPAQSHAAAAAGADPLADQRLGGLVMWVPLDFFYVALAVAIVAVWLRSLQRRWPEPVYGDVDAVVAAEPVLGRTR